ncbi:MAG: hypothetical protein JOZ57_12640 [Abitibacteriaceae bacterium]|nr:hypothetical protein [Abditibacteriaceae bacterium]
MRWKLDWYNFGEFACAGTWPDYLTRMTMLSSDSPEPCSSASEVAIPTGEPPLVAQPPVAATGDAVPVAQPPLVVLYQTAAFALSALLSPYLVIPAGTVGIVASQPSSKRQLILWTSLSVFFSTVTPALYVVIQILRGKITDVHVMEREQRGGPFMVAIASCFIGALVLRQIHAPPAVYSIGIVLAVNGIILSWITSFWKISMHVAVLSATVLAAIIVVPGIGVWRIVWLIPALIWARVTRKRHTLGQGMAACAVACVVTGTVLYFSINLWPRVTHKFNRAVTQIQHGPRT